MRHFAVEDYRSVVYTLTRRSVLNEHNDGVMIGRTVRIDGENFNEWECLSCGEIGRSPALTNPRGSQAESQRMLSWMRRHYPYHEDHISQEIWYRQIDEAIASAENQGIDAPKDDFGMPFIMCLNVPCQDEIAYSELHYGPVTAEDSIETTGREENSSGTIFFHQPPALPRPPAKDNNMGTSPTTSVTLYDVTPDQYAAITAIVNGEAPAATTKKAKAEKPEAEAAPTPAENFEPDAEATERKIYTEKALNKLVEKGKDGRAALAEIAESYGLDTKSKRAEGLRNMILAAQVEAEENGKDVSDKGEKDSDDFTEDEPKAKKDKKSGKADKKGKKGSKK